MDKSKKNPDYSNRSWRNSAGGNTCLVPMMVLLAVVLFLGSIGLFGVFLEGNVSLAYRFAYLPVAMIVFVAAISLSVSVWKRIKYLIVSDWNRHLIQLENARIERMLDNDVANGSNENMLYFEADDLQEQKKR